ncbi:MAG: radical SAM protein [Bacteroidetes bacterium]|nr:radical SAM protein [Bacteroidota bacterium]
MYIALRDQLKHYFYKKPFIWKGLETLQGLQYWWEYQYYYNWKLAPNKSSIREVNVEFSSACNLRCQFCGLDHEKPKTLMSVELLQNLLDTLLNDPHFSKVQVLNLYNGGETLLHPKRLELFELIAEYKKRAQREKKHFPEIWMVTNGMLLREKLSAQLLEMDVLDHLRLSLDGGTPERFEELRVNAKWKVFNQNVKTFCELNNKRQRKVKVSSITIVDDDKPLNTSWMHPEFLELLDLMDHKELRRAHNWAGDIEAGLVKEKNHKMGCGMLMHQMVLLPNGDVTVCCNDLNSKGVVGNLNKQSLLDVCNGEERRKYLYLLLKNRKKELPLCAECETF